MFAGPIIFAVFIVISSSVKRTLSHDVAQEMRASSMGFEGTRVEKDLISPGINGYSKRALMGFQVNYDQVLKVLLYIYARIDFLYQYLMKED